ncbi:MAG: DNA repair protein RecN [Lachnospiraceae bacterium]|nr:DNA repair protein RecN [Lachnospiraceae bacterium]
MLLNVHVKNLALIEDVDVYFDEGLNILTGETGAGKSIILDSINIALGHKAPKEMIREDAEFGLVELVFSVSEDVKGELLQYGISFDESDEIIISRKIINGRSVVKVNGETFSVSEVKNIASLLINIHGQHDNEILLHKNKHLEILDEYGGEDVLAIRSSVKEIYTQYMELADKLNEFDIDEEKRQRDMSLYQYQIEEITDAGLREGEDEELEEKFKLISNSMKIVSVLSEAAGYIGSDGVLGTIGSVGRDISKITAYDEKLSDFVSQIMDIEALCSDLSHEVNSYIDSLSFDEEESYKVSERLNLINNLKSKYGNTIEKINDYLKEAQNKYEILENFGEAKEKLLLEIDKKKAQYYMEAAKLSELRKQKAEVFKENLTTALKELNFMEVKFDVSFEESREIGPKGIDVVEFMISTNTGEAIKPLANVASGGELSRIMLGLKSIMADRDNIGTMIFDEIDSGISGRTAQKVSERLKVLSRKHQVICITHLPQIAAMADNHYLIEKTAKNNKTVTEIVKLSNDLSIKELARMLGGAEITESVLANAKEMKELAGK